MKYIKCEKINKQTEEVATMHTNIFYIWGIFITFIGMFGIFPYKEKDMPI